MFIGTFEVLWYKNYRGPIIRQLCVGGNKQTTKQTLDDEFHGFLKKKFFYN